MNVSWNWLRQLVSLPQDLTAAEASQALIGAGVAVDALVPVAHGLSGAVVVEVRDKRPHPKADKLTLVDVFDGQAVTQVVCGAPNVPAPTTPGASPRLVWARPGARLPSGMELSVREVRGIPSPGMLCAEDELGLSTDHGGLLILSPQDGVPIGADFATAMGLPDTVFALDVTANRPDLLGHLGVARELAALYAHRGAQLTPPAPALSRIESDQLIHATTSVAVTDAKGCPRYLARVLTGLTVRPSPLSVRLLLSRLGSRAIHNVVDATNLAMFLYGQPLHAFDKQSLAGQRIVVRRAQPGEVLRTLDAVDRALSPDDLVIADAEKPVALAGVMGGESSEVRTTTTEVLLEAAYFAPTAVRFSARRAKLHTEASHRFERGVDANAQLEAASAFCAEKMVELAGGHLVRGAIDVYPQPLLPCALTLRPARTAQILGTPVPLAAQQAALTSLGLTVEQVADVLQVRVPTFRPDLVREIDLIEEVGRLIGYNNIPEKLPQLHIGASPVRTPEAVLRLNTARGRALCAAVGFDEVQLFSMGPPARLRLFGGDALPPPILLENPLREELSALRTALLPGLLDALRRNLHHGLVDVRLFEAGEVFFPSPGPASPWPIQQTRLAGVLCGHRPYYLKPGATDLLDFADLRGILDELLDVLGYRTDECLSPSGVVIQKATPKETPWLHPGLSAVLRSASAPTGPILGSFGELHPSLRERPEIDLPLPVFCFELVVPEVEPAARTYQEPPRFPAITRDVSFFVESTRSAHDLGALFRQSGEPLLRDVHILDDFRDERYVPPGQKGVLFGLVYRAADRTLTDDEAQKAHDRVVAHLRQHVAIQLR